MTNQELDATTAPTCQTCRNGHLFKKRIPRMSGPAVIIGYIVLIPSLLGMLTSVAFWLLTTLGITTGTATSSASDPQAAAAGAGCCVLLNTGGTLCTFIACFVGGLLGWLLVMKKDVLQCNACGATIAAS